MKRVGKYEMGRTIGEGTFAKVKFAVETDTGHAVAIKVLAKSTILKHKMVHQVTTVKVSNVSLQASQRDLKEFSSFSGDIIYVEMQKENDLSRIAYITFKDTQGAETAMLLTGVTIVDMLVVVMPATDYELPAEALVAQREAAADVKPPTTGPQSALQKAEDMVTAMLEKGFVLGKDMTDQLQMYDHVELFYWF